MILHTHTHTVYIIHVALPYSTYCHYLKILAMPIYCFLHMIVLDVALLGVVGVMCLVL